MHIYVTGRRFSRRYTSCKRPCRRSSWWSATSSCSSSWRTTCTSASQWWSARPSATSSSPGGTRAATSASAAPEPLTNEALIARKCEFSRVCDVYVRDRSRCLWFRARLELLRGAGIGMLCNCIDVENDGRWSGYLWYLLMRCIVG